MKPNLPENKIEHWENFKKVHSEGVVAFISVLLGKEVDRDFFIQNYINLTTAKGSKSKRKKNAAHQFHYLTVNSFIIEKK